MEIRKPSSPSSFTGLEETPLTLDVGEDSQQLEKLGRRIGKLEMLLEVYDIPIPPWKDRR